MGEQFEKFEALLLDIRTRLERLESKFGPQPTCLTMPDAAKRLGVGLTKLKEMVRRGEVRRTMVGKVPMVPISEIDRIATPEAERPKVERAARAKAWVPIAKKRR